MTTIDISDENGRPMRIASVDEMKVYIAKVETRRDALAERMLGVDIADARVAEALSDQIEDVYIPRLMEWVSQYNVQVAADANDAHRRAKAQAIKARRS